MRRKYTFFFAVLVVVVPLTAAACAGGNGERPSIVLDQSIGGVALGEKRSDVERSLGRGVVVHTEDQKPPEPRAHAEQVRYPKQGLEVWYVSRSATPLPRSQGRVVIVLTRSPRYRTPEGVHVGSTGAELGSIRGLKCYGQDCQHGYRAVNRPGTGFRLDRPGGKVVYIGIGFGH